MQKVQEVRKRVCLFLYDGRVEEPKTYFCHDDMAHLGEKPLLDAAIRFGVELGFFKSLRGCVQLTAEGMLYVETNWAKD